MKIDFPAWFTRIHNITITIHPEDTLPATDPIEHIKNRSQILNKNLRELCTLRGVKYKSAHKLRHGHGVWGYENAKDMSQLKALSQNMMHSTIATTDQYGDFTHDRVGQIIGQLGQ